jgi:hypothetical protein
MASECGQWHQEPRKKASGDFFYPVGAKKRSSDKQIKEAKHTQKMR